MTANFPEALNVHQLFLELNRFICNQQQLVPPHSIVLKECTNLRKVASRLAGRPVHRQ
jgi:hypothetical protein